jgi:hypothetical protein
VTIAAAVRRPGQAADDELGLEEQLLRVHGHILDLAHQQPHRRLAHRLESPEAIWLPSVANASVVLPISRPILGVVSIFALVTVWKDFLWPLLMEYGYNPSRETLNVGIIEASSTTPQNLVLAASAMAAVPTLIFFLIFQRNLLSGLTAGSLKG